MIEIPEALLNIITNIERLIINGIFVLMYFLKLTRDNLKSNSLLIFFYFILFFYKVEVSLV